MFNEKIKELKAQIEGLNGTINTQAEEIRAKLNDEDLTGAEAIKNTREENKNQLEKLESDLALYESALEPNIKANDGKSKKVSSEEPNYRESVNNFIRSKGTDVTNLSTNGRDEIIVPYSIIKNEIVPTEDGIKKTDTTSVTSDDVSHTPEKEPNTVVDLKKYTRVIPAKKGKGSYPVQEKVSSKMISVAELEKNPALAKPNFKDVDWSVLTYRGAIPLSQESIDDADIDLVALVEEHVDEIKLNTTNAAIADTMKTFAPKAVAGLDELKAIQNVSLDPAYNVSYVVSQSFYQFLDTVKDENGRYMLQDSIISPTGKVFSGKPIFVLNDEVFGAEGDAHAWVGDIKRAILFADRKNLGLRWVDDTVYGQFLQAVTRFDVKVADANAGYYLTYTAPELPVGE